MLTVRVYFEPFDASFEHDQFKKSATEEYPLFEELDNNFLNNRYVHNTMEFIKIINNHLFNKWHSRPALDMMKNRKIISSMTKLMYKENFVQNRSLFYSILADFTVQINNFLRDGKTRPVKNIFGAQLFENQDSLHDVLRLFIYQLEGINSLSHSDQANNMQVITHLHELHAPSDINLEDMIATIEQIKLPGIQAIVFKNDGKNIYTQRLEHIHYPLDRIPHNIKSAVIPEVCHQDDAVILSVVLSDNDRRSWADLQCKINLFIKKAEWLYYAFNAGEHYKNLYENHIVDEWLNNSDCSYDMFCSRVKHHVRHQTSNLNRDAFFRATLLPAQYIRKLFSQYQLDVGTPCNADYERLIRRMSALGHDRNLSKLLDSPILDVLKTNVHACNINGKNAVDLANDYKNHNSNLKDKYSSCLTILSQYQPSLVRRTHALSERRENRVHCVARGLGGSFQV